ncbi:MAG: PorV/PorQ family protein [Candidatus Zixiibacteriota bacterium]|nr:MAG: PorV/PorQ family protein [candidate division Zixibacteria bacterium]
MRHYKNTAVAALVLAGLFFGGGDSVAGDINSNAGTSAFSFLKINVGARAVALGGAFTGLADDESALYYNPAGIASIDEKRFILGYHNYFVDMQSGFAGYIHALGSGRALGFYASYLNYGEFIETDEFGNATGEFSGGDFLLAVSGAMKKGYYLNFGVTAKFIYEKIQDFSATGIAVDLAAKYTSNRQRYSGGLMIQNLGFQLSSLGEEKDKLPLTFRGGFASNPRGLPFRLSADIILPVDNDPIIALGSEYFALKPLHVRLGWNTFGSNFRAAESDDDWAGFSVGIGIDVRKLQLSYAFSPSADLGESHRITLTGGF